MDTVPQTVNCVDVLPRTSRHLHSHLLWTSLEPGHCAVCLLEPHMNISKPSVNRSNTGVRTLISHHKRRTLVTLKYCFSLGRKMREISTVRSESVRLIENAWVAREMRETWQVWKVPRKSTKMHKMDSVTYRLAKKNSEMTHIPVPGSNRRLKT